jgi:hypothetical protein
MIWSFQTFNTLIYLSSPGVIDPLKMNHIQSVYRRDQSGTWINVQLEKCNLIFNLYMYVSMTVIIVSAELMFLTKNNSCEAILYMPRNTIMYILVCNQTHTCYQVIYYEQYDLFRPGNYLPVSLYCYYTNGSLLEHCRITQNGE